MYTIQELIRSHKLGKFNIHSLQVAHCDHRDLEREESPTTPNLFVTHPPATYQTNDLQTKAVPKKTHLVFCQYFLAAQDLLMICSYLSNRYVRAV